MTYTNCRKNYPRGGKHEKPFRTCQRLAGESKARAIATNETLIKEAEKALQNELWSNFQDSKKKTNMQMKDVGQNLEPKASALDQEASLQEEDEVSIASRESGSTDTSFIVIPDEQEEGKENDIFHL